MTSEKNGIFSSALFLENLRRFWLMSFVGFTACFLSGPFLIIARWGELTRNYALDFAGKNNYFLFFFNIALGVLTAITVFSYLNRVGSVSVMHAMPFSRRKLFVTNYVSGLVLALVPLVITYLLLLFMKQPVYEYDKFGQMYAVYDVYTAAMVWKVFLRQLVTLIYVYSLSVLACMVCGNGIIAICTACAFNLLPLAVYGLITLFSEKFLFGYVYGSDGLAVHLHPALMAGSQSLEGGGYPGWMMLIYVFAALLASALAYILYRIRRLEKAEDSYVFPFMEKFAVVFLTLCASTLVGFVANEEFNSFAGWIGFAVTLAAAFVIAQMIATKSFRIFNRNGLKTFVLTTVIIALVIAAFAFDVCGFEKRVPNTDRVKSAYLDSYLMFNGDNAGIIFKEKENIEDVASLHRFITEHKKEIEDLLSDRDGALDLSEAFSTRWLNIDYTLENGRRVSRQYQVPRYLMLESPEVDRLVCSKEATDVLNRLLDVELSGAMMEYNDYRDLSGYASDYCEVFAGNSDPNEPERTGIITYEYDKWAMETSNEVLYGTFVTYDTALIREFLEAIVLDELTMGYEDRTSRSDSFASVRIDIPVAMSEEEAYEYFRGMYGFNWINTDERGRSRATFYFSISSNMTTVMDVLKIR